MLSSRAFHIRRLLGGTLIVVAALAAALAVMAAGEWITHQARPIVIVVGGYIFLTSLVLLIARREL